MHESYQVSRVGVARHLCKHRHHTHGVFTARRDEAECLAYFGQPYADYMKRTKGFIPGLL